MSGGRTLDLQGQPIVRFYNRKQRVDRDLDELLGLSKGMLADGVINQTEAEFLHGWLQRNQDVTGHGPAQILYNRIVEMMEDRLLDRQEQEELFNLLQQFTGMVPDLEEVDNVATTLPLDRPFPIVEVPDKTFCFTGRFVSGTRRECEGVVIDRGGLVHPRITAKVDYLVVGYFGSEDWVHTSHGRKIEAAMSVREKGCGIKIVSEDHWLSHVYDMQVGIE